MEGEGFLPTDWKHRTRVEITAKRGKTWFCHLLTGGKDLLDVAIRVPEGTFRSSDRPLGLAIKTLDERTDLPIYGQWQRLKRRTLTDGWEEWRLYLRDFQDAPKAKLRRFLETAANAYFAKLGADKADPATSEPWKADGQTWHLSQGSISKRHLVRWKPAFLLALIGRFRSFEADLTVSWDTRTAVQIAVPGEPQVAGKIVTNIGRGLRVELRAPPGLLTPTQVDRLGEEVEIKRHVPYDRVVFWLRSLSGTDSRQLRDVWRRCREHGAEGRLQSA